MLQHYFPFSALRLSIQKKNSVFKGNGIMNIFINKYVFHLLRIVSDGFDTAPQLESLTCNLVKEVLFMLAREW